MYTLYVFPSSNSYKVIYVAEALELPFKMQMMDLTKGEQKSESFLALNPFGKVPTLIHEGKPLFESGAICRYLGQVAESSLYPKDYYQRALVDQWLDFFTAHLGRWLNTLFFEQVIKTKFQFGEPSRSAIEEALGFSQQQFKVVNQHLTNKAFFLGDQLTIADLFAFSYIEITEKIKFSIKEYSAVSQWYHQVAALNCVARARLRWQNVTNT